MAIGKDLNIYNDSYDDILKEQEEYQLKVFKIMQEHNFDEEEALLYIQEQMDDEGEEDSEEYEAPEQEEVEEEEVDETPEPESVEDDSNESEDAPQTTENKVAHKYPDLYNLIQKFKSELGKVADEQDMDDILDELFPDVSVDTDIPASENMEDDSVSDPTDLTSLSAGPIIDTDKGGGTADNSAVAEAKEGGECPKNVVSGKHMFKNGKCNFCKKEEGGSEESEESEDSEETEDEEE